MKRFLKIIFLIGIILCFQVVHADASEGLDKSTAKKLVGQFGGYSWHIIGKYYNSKIDKTMKMDDKQRAIAAALNIDEADKEGLDNEEYDEYCMYKISNSKLKKMSKNMFGKAIGKNKLDKYSSDERGLSGACCLKNGTPVVYYSNYGIGLDYVRRGLKIKKINNKKYQITEKSYLGYWGHNDGKSYNTIVKYTAYKNDKAQYGYSISRVSIKTKYK